MKIKRNICIINMNNHNTKKRSKSLTTIDEIHIQDDKKNKKEKKEAIKTNRPRIFSRDFNQLPGSCSPPC
jgi:hypothetical protein